MHQSPKVNCKETVSTGRLEVRRVVRMIQCDSDVWNEGTDEASSRRGGRSSGWGPGLGTTTFTMSLRLREGRRHGEGFCTYR